MAHTRQQRVEQFYRKNKAKLLASARKLDRECGEDLVQQVLAIWMRPSVNPQFTVMAFVRQMNTIVLRDSHQREGSRKKRKWMEVPTEVHGDIERMWRRRHGRRTSVKGGAE